MASLPTRTANNLSTPHTAQHASRGGKGTSPCARARVRWAWPCAERKVGLLSSDYLERGAGTGTRTIFWPSNARLERRSLGSGVAMLSDTAWPPLCMQPSSPASHVLAGFWVAHVDAAAGQIANVYAERSGAERSAGIYPTLESFSTCMRYMKAHILRY